MGNHNLQTKKKRMIADLVKGKEIAFQLRTLLEKPPAVQQVASASPGELLHQILKTFSKSISELTSSTADAATQIPVAAVDSAEKTKKSPPAGVKTRRGCYKRRRTSDSWTVESATTDDDFAWRKYGQKTILNSNFPRCYYRCTHKFESGCKATKQVQKIKVGKPTIYQTTYINHHTCIKASTNAFKADADSHLIKFYPSNSVESNNFMSFQVNQGDGVDNTSKISIAVDSEVKLEQQSSTTTDEGQGEEGVSDAKSTLHVLEDVQQARLEDKPEWAYQPGLEEMDFCHEYQFVDNVDVASYLCFDEGNNN